jgi:hypothetical protein
MATVTKDFKVKNGIKVQGDANIDASLYVAGPNATVNGSEIITEDIITGGTQTNIAVTYDAQSKTLNFVAENGVADSTTTDLAEGNNLYFTDERAQDAVGNSVGQGLTYDDAAGAIKANINSYAGAIGTHPNGWLEVKVDDSTIWTGGSSNRLMVKTGQDSPVASKTYVSDSINALTTSDIEEGTNLYFTTQRAIDAVGGAATSENTPNSIVLRDTTGSFAAEDITASELTANRLNFTGGTGSIDTNTVGMNIFAAAGDVNIGAMQGQVKIGGSEVTTADNTQSLTNKTILGDLGFAGTAQEVGTIGTPDGTSLAIDANEDLTISSIAGDIVIRPDILNEVGKAYIGSTTAGNEIATHGYVDNAVAGLAWKESVHLLLDARSSTTPPLTGPSGVLIIDGHEALTEEHDGYRILILTTSGEATGIYTYSDNGTDFTLARSSDADAVSELVGAAVFVMEGTQFNATSWVQSNHYLTAFADQNWTQFSGSGNYTAGFGINLVGREFSADTTEMATSEALGNAVSDLTDYVDGFLNSNDGTVIEYIDQQDSATLLAANGYSDTLVATGDETATPQYLAINVNDVAKQVAATVDAPTYGPHTAFAWLAADYRSAEFLVKIAHATHTEVSKVLITLDTSNNVAITEYGIVGTNGSLSAISAGINGNNVELEVSTIQNSSTVTVVGTLLK